MNDLAKKWVEALRSGKYQKGQGALHKKGKYCALGVACDVALKSGIPLKVTKQFDQEYGTNVTLYDNCGSDLPEKVRKALGLRTSDGDTGKSNLVDLNDTTTLSLRELADVIEFAEELLFEKEPK